MKINSKTAPVEGSVEGFRISAFLIFNLILLVAAYPLLIRLWQYSNRHVHFSHFVLIAPVVVYLFWTERRRIFSLTRWGWQGLPVLLLGVVLWLASPAEAGRLSQSGLLAWQTFSLWLVWVGGFLACFGWSAGWAAVFPLGFLLLNIPFPESVLNAVVSFLQHGSAEVVAVLFQLAPLPVLREGTIFHLPSMSIDVAPECSGIRSSIALCITALLAGFFFLRSPWRRFSLVAVAIPIAIFKNGLRITTLVLLAVYWDPSFLDGALHTRGGYPFFALSLIFMTPVLAFLRWQERKGN